MTKTQKFTATENTVQYNGQPLNILVTEGTHAAEHGLQHDGKCFLCGFKPRKGAHTYWVNVANTRFLTENYELLPFDTDHNDAELTLGWWEIGAECRKRIPPKFTKKKEQQ